MTYTQGNMMLTLAIAFVAGNHSAPAPPVMLVKFGIELQTGGDDKQGGGEIQLTARGSGLDPFVLSPRSEGLGYRNRKFATWVFPRPVEMTRISGFSMRFWGNIAVASVDYWHLTGLRVLGYDAAGKNYELFDDMKLDRKLGGAWVSPPLSDRLGFRPIRSGMTEVAITNGGDDLRSSTNLAWVHLINTEGRLFRQGSPWMQGGGGTNRIELPYSGSQLHRIEIVSAEHFKGGIFNQPDNWDVDRIRVTVPRGEGRDTIFDSAPKVRLASGDVWQSVQLGRRRAPTGTNSISFTLITSNDDLRGDSRAVVGCVLADGTRFTSEPFGDLTDRSLSTKDIVGRVDVEKIRQLFVRFVSGNGDGWNIRGLSVACGRWLEAKRFYENYRVDVRLVPGQSWTHDIPGR